MIDKVFPRKLNSSKDARVRGKDEMLDALNVTIDDNYDDFQKNSGVDSPSGNFGVLKPLLGNSAVTNVDTVDFQGNGRVIGSCVDDRNERIYYFLHSSIAAEQGIYFYSKKTNEVSPLITSDLFNFDSNSFVDSNIVYIPTGTGESATEVKPVLFFTDNINEPRKVDVSRASDSLYSSDDESFLDFISTCPRTPIDPPVATFRNDPTTSVTNFKGNRGFQFAYQNIYRSGDVSALSTYSKLSVPFAYINQGASPNASFFSENYLEVIVPQDAMTSEVERVRLLVREGNDGSWFIVDEAEYTGTQLNFSFYNNKILSILPEGETRRQFDSVPKKARSQEVTNNRLFFGNYVEGFDVDPMQAAISYQSLERPQDFISINLTLTPEVRNTNAALGNLTGNNRVAAYRLSTSNLPSEGVLANTQIIFNISLNPDGNFHLYESRSGYHGSTRYNYLRDAANDFEEEDGAQTINNQVGAGFKTDGSQYFAAIKQHPLLETSPALFKKTGVCHNPYAEGSGYPTWRSQFAGDTQGTLDTAGQDAVYGTNAGNPFIIQGKPLSFSGSFVTLADLSREELADAIKGLIIGPPTRIDGFDSDVIDPTPSISVINSVSTSSYAIDLGINNLQKLKVFGGTDPRADLIVAVGKQDSLSTEAEAKFLNPMGYFILNKATPEFRLRDISQFYGIDTPTDVDKSEDAFFALDLVDLGDFDILTCIPDIVVDNLDAEQNFNTGVLEGFISDPAATNIFDGWVCMTKDHIQFQVINMELADFEALFVHNAEVLYNIKEGTWTSNEFRLDLPVFTDISVLDSDFTDKNRIEQQIRRWFGFLVPEGATISLTEDFNGIIAGGFTGIAVEAGVTTTDTYLEFSGGRIINTFHNYAQDTFLNRSENIFDREDLYFDYAFSLLDGEAGAGGKNGDEASGQSLSSVSYQTIKTGVSPWSDLGATAGGQSAIRSALNCMPLIINTTDISLSDYIDSSSGFAAALGNPLLGGESEYESFVANLQSHVEVFDFETVLISPEQQGEQQTYKSFKTKANHDFGIVFYDQRGRSSDVTPIGSIYIPSYDMLSEKGPVQVQINLASITPPEWAWNYQIVYGGNSTVSDFVQYSTGGAFVEFDSDDPDNNGNIYVSLNYLQNNTSVSYSNAFGAINFDGNQDFYTYKEGDKLRIISYFGPLTSGDDDLNARVFPASYEFDIVGTVTLADDNENPLVNPDLETPDACTGQFVILRNNPSAVNFNYNAVRNGIANNSPQTDTAAHFWNNRCVVEIYSPRTGQDAEDRVYYEISKKYRVIRDGVGELTFEASNIVLTEGDVYFRRLPVNMPRYSTQEQVYKNLIRSDGGTGPRFLDYYLETKTFTDTIVGANQQNWGKPKIVNAYQKEIRRDSSITFSDVNNYSVPKLSYCTFDVTTSNFKDLPNSHGSIQRMIDRGDSVFIVQENKISDIPISRNIISDTIGTDIIVASEKVLGSQRFYSGNYGCSTNPESVTKIGESIYFANKESYEVYKFNPSNGVAIISEYGLKSYFRELFKSAIDRFQDNPSIGPVRVVGGYDPTLDEFVISVYNSVAIPATGGGSVTQGAGSDLSDPAIPTLGDAAALALEIADLEAQIGDLETDLSDATETIADLQQQILNLYGQINDAINNPVVVDNTANDPTLNDTISELEGEITIINDQIDDIEAGFESQVGQTVTLHEQIRLQAAASIQEANTFVLNASQSDPFLEASYTIPPITELDPNLIVGQPVGTELDGFTSGYQQLIEAYADELLVYLAGTGGPAPTDAVGRFSTTEGSLQKRDGTSFTFVLGYGIPTTASLSDDFASSFPEGTALFDDPNFVTRFSSLKADLDRLIADARADVFADVEEDLEEVKGEVVTLTQDKEDLLNQISAFVTGIYEGRGPIVNAAPEDLDAQGRNPFGVNYGESSDNISGDSPLKTLYDAAQTGDLSVLESEILGNPLTQSSILQLIENGLLDYRTDYQVDIDDKFAEITSLQLVRDSLAESLYNTAQFTYDLQVELNNNTDPIYAGGVPEEFYTLLDQGFISSPDDVVSALNGDTITAGEATTTFSNLSTNVSNLLSSLSGDDFVEPPAISGGASGALRQSIKDFVEELSTQLDTVGFPNQFGDAYDFESIINPDTSDAAIAIAIDKARESIVGGSTEENELRLDQLISNLQTLGDAAFTELFNSGFFSASQFDSGFVNSINIVFGGAAAPIGISPEYNDLFNVVSNIGVAVERLKEFQYILGAGGPTGLPALQIEPGTTDTSNFDTPVIPTTRDEFSPAVGYTGSGGPGLTAVDVLQGKPIANTLSTPTTGQTGPGVYTAYEGLKGLLKYVDNQMTAYGDTIGQEGVVTNQAGLPLSFNAYNSGSVGGEYPPFNFTGSLLDLIPSNSTAYTNIYNQLYSIIEAAVLAANPTNPVDFVDIDPNILLSVVNNLINQSIDFEKHQQSVLFSSAVFERGNNNQPPVLVQNLPSSVSVGTGGDEYSRLGSFSIDTTNDGEIGSADLLDFLVLFGNIDPRRSVAGNMDQIQNLLSQYRFTKLQPTGYDVDDTLVASTEFTNILISSLAPLVPFLPDGLTGFEFDNDPLSDTSNQIIAVGNAF